MTSRGRKLAAVAAVAATLLTACGGEDVPREALGEAAHPPATPAAITPVRDAAAVISALKQLDACALLDPASAAVPGFPPGVERERDDPHSCKIQEPGGYGEVELILGTPLDRRARFLSQPRTVAGTVVYVSQPMSECVYLLPVGPVHAIRFQALARVGEIGSCAALDTLVPVAVAKIATAAPPGHALAKVDACSVLAAALGDRRPSRMTSGFDWRGLDSCQALSAEDVGSDLRLRYTKDPARSYDGLPSRQVGGRTVFAIGDCHLAWSQGRSGLPGESEAFSRVELRADCDRLDALAAEVMRFLDAPPPDVPPVKPLLYPQGQTGLPDDGACADVPPEQPCLPSAHRPYTPHDPVALANAAAADPSVLCGLAEEAVRTHFGPELRPVLSSAGGTRTQGCLFVEPNHRRQVSVQIAAGGLSDSSDGRAVTVAGRPGVVRSDRTSPLKRQDLSVALVEGEDDTTTRRLEIGLQFNPQRGTRQDGETVDTTGAEMLDVLAGDIVARAF